jgi:hypothetical protein
LNGTDTRSPTSIISTSGALSTTSPVISWPSTMPATALSTADHVLVGSADIGQNDLQDHAMLDLATL